MNEPVLVAGAEDHVLAYDLLPMEGDGYRVLREHCVVLLYHETGDVSSSCSRGLISKPGYPYPPANTRVKHRKLDDRAYEEA